MHLLYKNVEAAVCRVFSLSLSLSFSFSSDQFEQLHSELLPPADILNIDEGIIQVGNCGAYTLR